MPGAVFGVSKRGAGTTPGRAMVMKMATRRAAD